MNHREMTREAESVQIEIYRNMSPQQKLEEFLKMRDLAWNLKAAGVRMQHPDWTDAQVEEAVRRIFVYATT